MPTLSEGIPLSSTAAWILASIYGSIEPISMTLAELVNGEGDIDCDTELLCGPAGVLQLTRINTKIAAIEYL